MGEGVVGVGDDGDGVGDVLEHLGADHHAVVGRPLQRGADVGDAVHPRPLLGVHPEVLGFGEQAPDGSPACFA